MPLDLDGVLFYGSLLLSLAAVVLFLALMRRKEPPSPRPSAPKGGDGD
jgi:hypothetical protein